MIAGTANELCDRGQLGDGDHGTTYQVKGGER